MRSEPTEAAGVIGVSSVGPINLTQSPFPRKAYYSNYGLEQTDVSAPGGERREFFGTPHYNAPENRILVPYLLNVAVANSSAWSCSRRSPWSTRASGGRSSVSPGSPAG